LPHNLTKTAELFN